MTPRRTPGTERAARRVSAAVPPLRLLTVTWSGDLPHFRLQQESLRHSALADCPHQVVVQTEDAALFADTGGRAVQWHITADVLPGDVDRRRRHARAVGERAGRTRTRLMGSLAARTGSWPRWVRYTGWHTQQLAKLAAAAASDIDTVVVLDSDLLALPGAGIADFIDPDGRIVCFERWAPAESVRGKQANWNAQARVLFGDAPAGHQDVSFDTPFVLHAPTVRAMLAALERQSGRSWWDTLLSLPPRRWSEFAIYRRYLRNAVDPAGVAWRPDGLLRHIADASDTDRLCDRVRGLMRDPEVHYVTIHSQSSGRGRWGTEHYASPIASLLREGATAAPSTPDGG